MGVYPGEVACHKPLQCPYQGLIRQPLARRALERADKPLALVLRPVVEAVALRIDVRLQVERLDADVRALDAPLEEAPEVLQPVRVDVVADVRLRDMKRGRDM